MDCRLQRYDFYSVTTSIPKQELIQELQTQNHQPLVTNEGDGTGFLNDTEILK